MKDIRTIAATLIVGIGLLPVAALAAGNNAADHRVAATASLPACSSATKGDCHIHSRESYLQILPDRPDEKTQPHAWWEFDTQQREAADMAGE